MGQRRRCAQILMNERYTGVLIFGQRRWVKVPGTGKRVPQTRDASEVIRQERPELRIIDEATWAAAAARLASTRALFTVGEDGRRKGRGLRARTSCTFSPARICCDACKTPMTIAGTRSGRCYRVPARAEWPLRSDCERARRRGALVHHGRAARELTASPGDRQAPPHHGAGNRRRAARERHGAERASRAARAHARAHREGQHLATWTGTTPLASEIRSRPPEAQVAEDGRA